MRVALLPEVTAFLKRQHGHFIDGQPREGTGAERIEVINPSDDQPIATVATATSSDIEAAVASSLSAFNSSWRHTLPAQRAEVLYRLADLLEQHREALAQLETLQSGKLISLARNFEITTAAAFLRHYAGAATRITGETITPSIPSFGEERYTAFTRREPLGVVVGIVPWNFSIMIAVWKFASALATGCTAIIKSSEFTPLTMLRIAEIALDAGVPAGVLNVINGKGEAGSALISHQDVAKVSFTGSVPTGIAVGTQALQSRLTRFTLELGGKNAAGFLPDCPIEKIIDGIFESGFINQGQICAAAERFYVPQPLLDDVLTGIKQRLEQMQPGDPLDEQADYGPVANRAHLEKLNAAFAKARQEGDQVITGGHVLDRPGCYVAPTIIRAHSPNASLLHEETFGPVGTFIGYDTEQQLVEAMNAGPYGLSASLWTNNLSKALQLIPQINAGTLWVNMHTLLDPAVPFGGIKSSGMGREFGDEFINDYTELKSVLVRY
ncbi:aldehyde dehydrogenase family protein [Carnimonas bestiolae]|uniref:aldehyde dehydrogenase family protein n=1 Tax=Carnimonas bestiolae TaxID=3402172 RepID=UPI003EDC0367